MHRWTDLSQVPADVGPSFVTIGNFDGVHRGHRQVLTRMVTQARAARGTAVAVTFHPHPAKVHHPDSAPELLTGIADRMELLAETGLDAVLLVEYTAAFARTTAEEFVLRYLVDGLHAATVVVGRDVRFGRDNAGDLATMVELGQRHGFAVEVIEDVHGVDDGHADDGHADHGHADHGHADHGDATRRWSSTWVRELLAAGDVAGAAEILGRYHRVRGVVVHGDARGRGLGYPTANLAKDASGMVPADGVYAGWLRRVGFPPDLPDAYLPVAISVGTNPTFDGVDRRVEGHVPDRTDLDLYDEEVVLEFVARLRPTVRFDSVDDLLTQMAKDVDLTRLLLAPGPAV